MKQRILLGTIVAIFVLVMAGLTAVSRANPAQQLRAPNNNPYGIVEAYEAPDAATELGVGWTRILFRWNDIQPDDNTQWEEPLVSEAQIDAEIAVGRDVVGLLIGIPDWARDPNGLPKGHWLPHSDPNNLWARFVEQTVKKYEGRITHWVIWNEPDVWDDESFGHTWEGNVTEYAQLHRTAFHTIRDTDPNAKVHLTAFTYYWDSIYGRKQYLQRLLEVFDADPQAREHNYYFDVATAHLYYNPSEIDEILQVWRGMLAQRQLTQPFWLIETNAAPSNDTRYPVLDPRFNVTEAEQAAFIPQIMTVALLNDVERMGIYKLKDNPKETAAEAEPFGLIRADGSRRPAFNSYRLAMLRLRGTESAVRDRWDEIGQATLTQYGQQTTVMFSRTPSFQIASVPAISDTAVIIDSSGAVKTVTSEEGVYNVQLTGARCGERRGDFCMIGGDVVYLIQSTLPTPTATIPPTETIEPPAVITATSSPEAQPTEIVLATVIIATQTPLPTATEVLATDVPPISTETALPPTPTLVPTLDAPTSTIVPATSTPIPPTATEQSPTMTPTTVLVTATGTPLVSLPTVDPNATQVSITSEPETGGFGTIADEADPTESALVVTATLSATETVQVMETPMTTEPSVDLVTEVAETATVAVETPMPQETAVSQNPLPTVDTGIASDPAMPTTTTLPQPATITLIDLLLIGGSALGILLALWVIIGRRDDGHEEDDY